MLGKMYRWAFTTIIPLCFLILILTYCLNAFVPLVFLFFLSSIPPKYEVGGSGDSVHPAIFLLTGSFITYGKYKFVWLSFHSQAGIHKLSSRLLTFTPSARVKLMFLFFFVSPKEFYLFPYMGNLSSSQLKQMVIFNVVPWTIRIHIANANLLKIGA